MNWSRRTSRISCSRRSLVLARPCRFGTASLGMMKCRYVHMLIHWIPKWGWNICGQLALSSRLALGTRHFAFTWPTLTIFSGMSQLAQREDLPLSTEPISMTPPSRGMLYGWGVGSTWYRISPVERSDPSGWENNMTFRLARTAYTWHSLEVP